MLFRSSPIVVKVGQVWNTVGNGTVNVTNGPKSGDVLTSNDLNLQGISTTAVQKLLTGKKGEAISADALNQVKSLLTNKAVEGTKAYTVDGNNYHYEYWLQSVDQNRTYGSPVTLTYSASLKWDGEIASATASQVASLPSASASSTSQAQTESAVAASQAAATSTAYTTMVATSTSSTSSYTSSLSSSEEAAKEWIAQKESSGSYTVQNRNYYGKYQLSISYLNGDYSAANQEKVADQYVASRYGSWTAAQAFWESHGWY